MRQFFLKSSLFVAMLLLGMNVSAQYLFEPIWTVPADATTGLCSVRTATGYGDSLFGSNYRAGTIEEWKDGILVASYDVNKFCADNQLGETVMVIDYETGTETEKFQSYLLWTAVMVDDAGNLLVNVGTSSAATNTCQNWVLLPASDRNAMQLLHIDEFPSADVTPGRVDVPSRIVGNITDGGAYLYIPATNSALMPVMYIALDGDGKIYCDAENSWILMSSVTFDASTNVATFQTADEILGADEAGVAAKTYVRWRGQGAVFTWNAETSSFEKNESFVPGVVGTPGMDVFKIGEIEYIVLPVKSATTGNRGSSVAIYCLADGTQVASWDATSAVDYYVGSVQARVNPDGKTANIYVCGHHDCFGILEFSPGLRFVTDGISYKTTSSLQPYTVEIEKNNYSGNVVIPESVIHNDITYSVTSIGRMAFSGCSQVESVTIPGNVMTIKDNAFMDCDNLSCITMKSTTPPIVYNTSFSAYAYLGATLYVPSGSAESYKKATGWKNFVNIEEFASAATGIEIESEKTLEVGVESKISVKIIPENALFPILFWNSDNETVAKVSNEGVVTAISAGNAIITATGEEGISATCTVTVMEKGDNYMAAENVVVEKGTSFTLPIEMDNANDITGFQCDIYLPEGTTLATIEDEYDINLSSRGTSSHVIMSSLQEDGSIRIISYSSKSEAFKENEGTLFTMNLNQGFNYNGGEVSVKNIIISTTSGTGYTCPDFSFKLDGYTNGDANNDGTVNVIDVVNTANYILGNMLSNFVFQAADITGDGEVNIVDIVNLTNLILNGSTTNSTASLQNLAVRRVLQGETEANRIYIDDFSIAAGEELEIAIKMDNEVAFTAFEFNIFIPEGLSVYQEDGEYIFDLSDRKTRSHTISSALQEDGSIKVMSYSTSSKNFSGNSGDMVYFTIVADANYSGMSQIEIKDIILSTNGSETETGDAVGYYPSDEVTVVTDKNDPQSGVDNAWSENNLPVEYYNLQGLRVDSNNLTHGIYIKRQGGKTTKVIL